MGRAYTFSVADVAVEDALSLRQGSFQIKSSETSLQGNLQWSIINKFENGLKWYGTPLDKIYAKNFH